QVVTGDYYNVFPTKNLMVSVDREAVLKSGLVDMSDSAQINDRIMFNVKENVLTKPELALLNIVAGIAKDGWKRPLQFSCGFAGGDDYNGLEEYMIMQGLTNKLVPIRVMGSSPDVGAPQQVSLDKSLDLY